MRHRLAFLLLAIPLVALSGCRRGGPELPPPPPPSQAYPPPILEYYDNAGGIQDSLALEIRDAARLREVWERATSRQTSPPPVPQVDFAREMVIVVGAGRMRPDDQIEVDSVYLDHPLDATGRRVATLNVIVRKLIGCGRFETDAYPVAIVRLRRFDGPVKYIGQRVDPPPTACGRPEPPMPA